jgi:hypothetical protein
MSASVLDAEVERRWAAWLVERNRRGLRLGLFIMITLYPAFGVVDWLLAPADALPWIWGTRTVVVAITFALFAVLRSRAFARNFEAISASYTWLGAAGVSVMTTYIGGLASPYYAGVSLIVLAAGLLLVWRPAVVVVTHSAVVTTFVVMNAAVDGMGRPATTVSNLAFLSTTALVAAVGQILTYRSHREQLVQRMQLEASTG